MIEILTPYHVIGWRRNYKFLGRPDFVFPKKRVALFADGCFWHGHNCRNVNPSDNAEYWQNKIARNKARDKAITSELVKKGWKVVRIWECEIKKGEVRKLMAAVFFMQGVWQNKKRLIPLALDGGDSATRQAEFTPEVLSLSLVESRPTRRH